MAKKADIIKSDIDALTKLFFTGPGFHLGVVKFRPKFMIANEGLYNLVWDQFTWLINDGWSYGELDELLKEARRVKRLLTEPNDVVKGRSPKSKQKNPARNLLAYHDRETLYYHPELQVRRMPCVVLDTSNKPKEVSPGEIEPYKTEYTLGDLIAYWKTKVSVIDEEETIGIFDWFVDKYPLPTILHGIDRLSESMKDERDADARKRIDIFSLKTQINELERERQEVSRWL